MNTTTTEIITEPRVPRRNPLAHLPALPSEVRTYLHRLREAEMAEWEQSGGDYLLSKCVNQVKCTMTVG
jgi:hypothetical protein